MELLPNDPFESVAERLICIAYMYRYHSNVRERSAPTEELPEKLVDSLCALFDGPNKLMDPSLKQHLD